VAGILKDANLPDWIVLKVHMKSLEGSDVSIGGTTVAEAVKENVIVPRRLMIPSAELESLPVDDFK